MKIRSCMLILANYWTAMTMLFFNAIRDLC